MTLRGLWKWLVVCGLIALPVACAMTGEDASGTGERFVPSEPTASFAAGDYRNFADYVDRTRNRLRKNKIYMNPANATTELAAATPFELAPSEECVSRREEAPSRGILLVHGLSDMPFAMRDLASVFAERCFLVRTILLPGHGTRAGDLLEVTREEWLNATRFGLDTLKRDVDKVFVGGFSLGGLLAAYTAVEDHDISGVFAFSPALALNRSWQLSQAVWLRHFITWADRDEQDDYARYEAMPVNGLAETYLLTEDLRALLQQGPVPVPVFMAQSADDPIIDIETNDR